MKRFWALFFIFSLLLCGCTTGQANSLSQSYTVPQSSSVEENSSTVETNAVASDNSQQMEYKFKDVFLEVEPDKSKEYNSAIIVYNEFLKSEMADNSYPYSIVSYTLKDINKDGIPELICTVFAGYGGYFEMYTYKNEKIEMMPLPEQSLQHGGITFLENGMIASCINHGYEEWDFYEYNPDGTVTKMEFNTYNKMWMINGKEVSKEEFDVTMKPYLDGYSKEAKDLQWQDVLRLNTQ